MIKELLTGLESALTTHFTAGGVCSVYIDRYKGEFSEGADTNPKLPCVLTELVNYKPTMILQNGMAGTAEVRVLLYIADKDINTRKTLDTVESVLELMNGGRLTFTVGTGQTAKTYSKVSILADDGMVKQGYYQGVELYTISLNFV